MFVTERRGIGMEKRVKTRSLKQIFLGIFILSVSLCLILIAFVTNFSIRLMHESRAKTSLTATLRDISASLDSQYNALLQISQNAVSAGLIGKKYDEYLTSENQYDKIIEYREFYESLNIAIWGESDILLAAYVQPGLTSSLADKVIFSNFNVSKSFAPEQLEQLLDTGEIIFQPIHFTYNSVLDKAVVSIMRPTEFSNGQEAIVYLEARSNETVSLEERTRLEQTSYVFLQLDEDFRVRYSDSGQFDIGTRVSMDSEGMVRAEDYIGTMVKSKYGFYNVLLMPLNDYRYETNQWMFGIFLVIFVSFAILAIVSISQIWLISHPLKVLERDMGNLGNGDFSPSAYGTNLSEFNRLFEAFNTMKLQIHSLLEERQRQEKEKARLELDKLMYQINPHFLMNALNSVHWMAVSSKQKEIDLYVQRLSYILAYSLGKTEYRTTLRTELKYLENYLNLQQCTYDFQCIWQVEEGPWLDQPCARFILQPIAENAVCHNMNEFGHLWIQVSAQDETVHIVLRDDGKGFVSSHTEQRTEREQGGRGIGLRYVKMSLDSFYGNRAVLSINSKTGEGTEVSIALPREM